MFDPVLDEILSFLPRSGGGRRPLLQGSSLWFPPKNAVQGPRRLLPPLGGGESPWVPGLKRNNKLTKVLNSLSAPCPSAGRACAPAYTPARGSNQ